MKKLLLILALSTPAMAETHLSTIAIAQGNGDNLTMEPYQILTEKFSINPRPGNETFTSIKSCLSTHENQSVTMTVTLINTDTNQHYYWHKHAGNDCNKEVFDIPVHTHHPLELSVTCAAYPLDSVKESANGNRKQYCRGWFILSSQIKD